MLVWLALCSSPAFADKPSQASVDAEVLRLHDELQDLSTRQAWAGVDRMYRQLCALPGYACTYADHMSGAYAAKQLGDVNDAWARYHLAAALDGTEEVWTEVATIGAWYGAAVLKAGGKGPVTLEVTDLAMDPTQSHVVAKAREALAAERAYTGVLPLGRYSLCGSAFEIVGGPEVDVKAKCDPPSP